MYFWIQDWRCPGSGLADEVQRHAVGLEAGGHGAEEPRVMAQTYMLEHADRDDPVEAAIQRAVVQQLEIHPLLQAHRFSPRPRFTSCSVDSVMPVTRAP